MSIHSVIIRLMIIESTIHKKVDMLSLNIGPVQVRVFTVDNIG